MVATNALVRCSSFCFACIMTLSMQLCSPLAVGSGGALGALGTGKRNGSFVVLRHAEKESMHDYIMKKRQIFLVQMQLESKQEELCRLEDITYRREEQVRSRLVQSLCPVNKALKHDCVCTMADQKL